MTLRSPRQWTLSTWIVLGLVLGIATGLFLGELASPLSLVADAFIRLLQMAVLPYIVVSLVGALGRLDRRHATAIARAGAGALGAIWGVTLLLVAAMPLAFPPVQGGAFFSSNLVEPHVPFDLVGQYIPANPFQSLSENVVPAVVLFSIALGVALMTVPRREALLGDLAVLSTALTRVNDFVVTLTPIGLFAIAASATATLGIAEFERVQVYVVTFVALGLVLALGILPALVAVTTPLRHRDVLRAVRDPLLTALATGSLFVVLPQLAERTKSLIAGLGAAREDTDLVADVVVPVSFNFPHAGKVLTLGFVLFAAWAAGVSFRPDELATLAAAGLLSVFGSVHVALPYLLDLFSLPADMFQLFLAVSVVNFRVATLIATVHTLVFALLATATVSGHLRLHWGALARLGVLTLLVTGAMVTTLHGGLRLLLADAEPRAALVTERRLLGPAVEAVVRREPPSPNGHGDTPALERIRRQGVLRVGYDPETLPFAYFNRADLLVGFDVDMAHALARDLGVTLEFVPLDRARLAAQLDAGLYDVAMSGIALAAEQSSTLALTRPYLQLTMAFVVRDARRRQFDSRLVVRRLRGLRIGVTGEGYYANKVRQYLPSAELVTVASLSEFFERRSDDLDALVHAAEIASAWTLLHPGFTVAVPVPDRLRVPIAYAVDRDSQALRDLLDTWIVLKEHDQTIDRFYEYWVLGSDEANARPRWSVVRNVLGWVE